MRNIILSKIDEIKRIHNNFNNQFWFENPVGGILLKDVDYELLIDEDLLDFYLSLQNLLEIESYCDYIDEEYTPKEKSKPTIEITFIYNNGYYQILHSDEEHLDFIYGLEVELDDFLSNKDIENSAIFKATFELGHESTEYGECGQIEIQGGYYFDNILEINKICSIDPKYKPTSQKQWIQQRWNKRQAHNLQEWVKSLSTEDVKFGLYGDVWSSRLTFIIEKDGKKTSFDFKDSSQSPENLKQIKETILEKIESYN